MYDIISANNILSFKMYAKISSKYLFTVAKQVFLINAGTGIFFKMFF